MAQVVSNVVDFRMPLDEAMKAPRFHAQDYPDRIDLTVPGIPDSVVQALELRGHTIRTRTGGMGFGWAQAIMRVGSRWHGVSEPAGHGLAAGY